MPPAIVLDTNVLLDWLVFRDPDVGTLVTAVTSARLRWLICPQLRSEFEHMLSHRSMARWSPDLEAARTAIECHANSLPDPPACGAGLRCRDADDQVFIDLALAQHARWLFTHDKDLLRLARRAALRGTIILTPARWTALQGSGA